jgi:hypothetical protein
MIPALSATHPQAPDLRQPRPRVCQQTAFRSYKRFLMQRFSLVGLLCASAVLTATACGTNTDVSDDNCDVCPANCPSSGGMCSKQDGLVANYGFEEFSNGTTSVQRNDSTDCAHHLSDPFSVMSTSTRHGGSRAARFQYAGPGIRNQLVRADSPSLSVFHAGRSYTIAAWFQILRGDPASGKIIIKGAAANEGNTGEPVREFGLEYQHCPRPDDCWGHPVRTNHLHYVVFDSSANPTAVAVEVPTAAFDPEANLGRWQFVMVWHNDATRTASLQLNGGTIYSESTAGLTIQDTAAPVVLGGLEDGFDGILDDVMIWNRVLTASERASVFDRGLVCP